MKKIWIAIVRLFGWKFDIPDLNRRPELHHAVFIEAPHTSIYDFLVGAACVWKMGVNGRFFIKKEFFVFPIRRFLHHCGAVPVDRGNKENHMVDQAVTYFNQHDDFTLIITPEGTRKRVKRFKRGFYEIAIRAQVPIVLTYINYSTKTMGVGPTFQPTGDYHADMQQILKFYEHAAPRNREGWDLETLKKTYNQ